MQDENNCKIENDSTYSDRSQRKNLKFSQLILHFNTECRIRIYSFFKSKINIQTYTLLKIKIFKLFRNP